MGELLGSLARTVEVDLITPAIPFFLAFLAVEVAVLRREAAEDAAEVRRTAVGFERKDTFASLAMGIGSLVFPVLLLRLLGLGGYVLLWEKFRLFDLGNGWVAWAIAIVGVDLAYYFFHRYSHEWRFLWAAHIVHHSSEHYNYSTALRQSWTPLVSWPFYVPLVLLGINPALLAMSYMVNLLYQFWIHTEAVDRLPAPIEYVFNTPSHHRVHHGVNPQYLDRNYGGILILFDRWFGTFEPEVERVRYGITKPVASFNPFVIATHEYANLFRDMRLDRRWSTRVQRLWRGPGWYLGESPDRVAA